MSDGMTDAYHGESWERERAPHAERCHQRAGLIITEDGDQIQIDMPLERHVGIIFTARHALGAEKLDELLGVKNMLESQPSPPAKFMLVEAGPQGLEAWLVEGAYLKRFTDRAKGSREYELGTFSRSRPTFPLFPPAHPATEPILTNMKGQEKMNDKTLNNSDVKQARTQVPDIEVFGDGDMFKLLCKASSESEGWMKSTKAMPIPGIGCMVQVTTQQRNRDGSYSVAEALTFVPGVTIEQSTSDGKGVTSRRLVSLIGSPVVVTK